MSLDVGDGNALAARTFSHEAMVMYLVDEGTHFSYVQQSDVAEAGMTDDELHAIGVENLRKVLPTLQMDDMNGVFMFRGNGSLEASMLLEPSLWDHHLKYQFPNGPVAAIPARDTLAVCDRNNMAGLEQLQSASRHIWDSNGDHLLSKDLYVRSADGLWRPFISGSNDAAPTTHPHDPTTRVADVGLEEITVTNNELGGALRDEQIQKMHASGYRFNPGTMTFHRLFLGEFGAPERPWVMPGW